MVRVRIELRTCELMWHQAKSVDTLLSFFCFAELILSLEMYVNPLALLILSFDFILVDRILCHHLHFCMHVQISSHCLSSRSVTCPWWLGSGFKEVHGPPKDRENNVSKVPQRKHTKGCLVQMCIGMGSRGSWEEENLVVMSLEITLVPFPRRCVCFDGGLR